MHRNDDDWTVRIVTHPAQRDREFRKAARIETVFSLLAAAYAVLAVWGFTAGTSVLGGIDSTSIGGVAVLCFAACMAVAASGGIRKRFVILVKELDARRYR